MSQVQQWQELLEQPLAFVDRQRLAACFPAEVAAERIHALRKEPRFQPRLLELLQAHFQLQPLAQAPMPADEDLPVLLMTPEAFRRLPRLCGAIWHAATLSREIRSEVVNQLRAALGNEVFALALAHRSLAGAADLLRQPDELLAAIDHDGALCVSAWLQAQPPLLRDWLRLRLSDPGVHDPRTPVDIRIVRSLAATLAHRETELKPVEVTHE
jgi:hypothetical protein